MGFLAMARAPCIPVTVPPRTSRFQNAHTCREGVRGQTHASARRSRVALEVKAGRCAVNFTSDRWALVQYDVTFVFVT
jgi:hypothetical protein